MRTKRLGHTDLELTTVGLGTWAIGGVWQYGWGPQDDADSIKAILEALDNGINWIDTAPIYGLGHSETIVAKALKQTSQKPIIATKCGLLWDNLKRKINSLKEITSECEQSLRRLNIDAIDLYQIHWPEPDGDIEFAIEQMAKLVEQGKVKYIGLSNFSVEQIKRSQKIHPVASLQPPYSMVNRAIEDNILGYCSENNIGVIVYSPMQRGLLTGKFDQRRLKALPETDHRKRDRFFQEHNFSAAMELIEGLKPIAVRNNKTLAQLAVSWTLRKPEVTAAIVGARKPGQISETVKAADWILNESDITEIEKLLDIYQKEIST